MPEWLQNFGRGVGDAFFNRFFPSTNAMTVRVGFLVGFVLGIGVGSCISVAVTLKVVNGSLMTGTKASRRNRKASEFKLPSGNPMCVKDLEKNYFHGIDEKADLNENQIQQLKEFLENHIRELGGDVEENVGKQGEVEENVTKQGEVEENVKKQCEIEENVGKLTACTTLAGILHLLSDLKLVQPKSYRKILTILQTLKIDVNVESLVFYIDGLEQAVSDIEAERTPRVFERDQFELDVLILHTDDDREEAFTFKEHLVHDGGIKGLSVKVIEEFGCGKGIISGALGEIFTRTRYIFVFVTNNWVGEKLDRYISESALVDSLYNTDKNFRIIPVWTTTDRLEVPELGALHGLKYCHFMANNKDSLYLTYLNTTLKEGREKFVKA